MQDYNLYQTFAKKTFGFAFKDPELLVAALTHRSYMNEHKKSAKEHNERLEFLGDAVLELVVTEYLYTNYSEPEGILTNWRAALVRTESIGAAGARLNLGELMRLSRGEKHGSDRAREQILANAFEAVTGAMYLDQGYDVAKEFIHKNILSTFDEILETGSWRDPKSRLQEVAQSREGQTPVYKVIEEAGPDHDKTFTLGVYVAGKLKGQGTGPSKQFAQQEAAKAALATYTTEQAD
jgi:ribonuclease-3